MLDLVIRGGRIVDGTGRPGYTGDVGLRDGSIVALGPPGSVDEPARRSVDADGLIVAPGFIDVHTHHDAQVFWDDTLSPSPLHGVTSVFSGNCGFSLAPLDPHDSDYLLRMLAQVEGMPLEALQAGVHADWASTADYLDRVSGGVVPNIGFLVGHSALRRWVMHDEANEREATPAEITAMRDLLDAGLAAGGMGFSSTWSATHSDHNGDPVPSRAASREELLALCEVLRGHDGTTLEFIPPLGAFTEATTDLLAEMSRTARRPLNWNLMLVYPGNEEQVAGQLRAGDRAEAQGAQVVALTLPEPSKMRLTFTTPLILDQLPGWDAFWRLPVAGRLEVLADPVRRAALDASAQAAPAHLRQYAQWGRYRLEASTPEAAPFTGRTVEAVAAELGTSDWEALCVVLLRDRLQTGLFMPARGDDDATWARRQEVWRDRRTLIGGSDAGAHLDTLETFSYATRLLEVAVRRRPLLSVEEAVRLLTGDPAALYGLRGRGRLAEGFAGDLVLFDLASIAAGEPVTRHDLPDGSGRIYSEPDGVHRVFVNGVEVATDNRYTGDRPGRVLRSGQDTRTGGRFAPDSPAAGAGAGTEVTR